MAAKPPVTYAGANNEVPVVAEQQADTEWGIPTASRDGHHATIGAKADAAASSDTGTFSLIALLKRLLQRFTAGTTIGRVEQGAPAADANAWPVKATGRNTQVGGDLTAIWANSAPVNTQQQVDVALPATPQANGKYVVLVRNPSAVTALVVQAKVTANTFDGATRYPILQAWSVAPGAEIATVVEGWLVGHGARLTLRNATVLGGADGFTATVRVIQI